MKSAKMTHRHTNLLGLTVCVAALLVAVFYMEKILGLRPCALCILSRYVIAIMGVIFFLGLLDNGKRLSQLWYSGVNAFWALVGLVVAGRHIWIQSHPSTSCNLGTASGNIINFITRAFAGTHDCSLNEWQFLGLTVPEQTMVLFFLLTVLVAFQVFSCLRGGVK